MLYIPNSVNLIEKVDLILTKIVFTKFWYKQFWLKFVPIHFNKNENAHLAST